MAEQPLVLQLTLTFGGRRLMQGLRQPLAGEGLVFKFGRNHAFAGQYPYQQVGVVSGSHFVLHVHDDRTATITDTSSNGTFVNGVQLQRGRSVRLSDGDRITLIGPTPRVGLFEVQFVTAACTLEDAELALVRRYVQLLSEDLSPQVKRERQRIDKEIQAKLMYPLGDFDPKKKKEDSADSLSSGSLGAADGHNATLHFKAPIHIVLAKQHRKVRPGMRAKELPDPQQVPGSASPEGASSNPNAEVSPEATKEVVPAHALSSGDVDSSTQRYCCACLNYALVRVYRKIHADNSESPDLATLSNIASLLDALEQSILSSDGTVGGVKSSVLASVGSAPVSTPTRSVGPKFFQDVRRLTAAMRKVDDSVLGDDQFQRLLHSTVAT